MHTATIKKTTPHPAIRQTAMTLAGHTTDCGRDTANQTGLACAVGGRSDKGLDAGAHNGATTFQQLTQWRGLHLDPLSCVLSSCLRLIGGGLSQLGPDYLPVVGPQFTPRHDRLTHTLDGWAFFNRYTSVLPVANGSHGNIKAFSQNCASTHHLAYRIKWVNTVNVWYFSFFHAVSITRFVLTDQHHVLTLFVFNRAL